MIRCEKLVDIFKSKKFPYMSWATYPDATEFWTPSPCDSVREIFMAQTVAINQMLDNAEQINRPTKFFDSGAIENPSLLKYNRGIPVPFKGGTNLNSAVKIQETPSITTSQNVYNILDQIAMVVKTKVLNTTMSGSSRWKTKFPMFGLMELMHRIMGLIMMAGGLSLLGKRR